MNTHVMEQDPEPTEKVTPRTPMHRPLDRMTRREIGGISMTEAVGGVIATVLAILGLLGIAPTVAVAFATIGVGVALLVSGGVIATQFKRAMSRLLGEPIPDIAVGGILFQSLCGAVGVALGILALIGVAPMTLLGSAAIVLGSGLLMAGDASERMHDLAVTYSGEGSRTARMTLEAVRLGSGPETAIGFASIVLGILSLAGVSPLRMVLVAMLALGCSVLLSGSAITGRALSLLK